eukprot:jgi/Ulvmu1/12465/UM009_0117.1
MIRLSAQLLLVALSSAGLQTGLAARAQLPGDVLRARDTRDQPLTTGAAEYLSTDGAADVELARPGRSLSTKFVRRTSGRIVHTANATSGAQSGHAPSGDSVIITTSNFTLRLPDDDSAPFFEETTVVLSADGAGVTENTTDSTTTTSPGPAPRGKKDDGGKNGVDFPRVPEDKGKRKAPSGGKMPKAPTVAKVTPTAPKKPPPSPPPTPPPQKVKAPPTTRSRPRSSSRRGREARQKPPSSGGRERREEPEPAPPRAPSPPTKDDKKGGDNKGGKTSRKSRGESRFVVFESKAKGRGTKGETRFGFSVFE